MKLVKIFAVILLSLAFVGANAQSFNVEKTVEEKTPNAKILPNITVLSLEGKEVEFTAACGMKHVVLCNLNSGPNLGNWMAEFKKAGIHSVSLISWAPILSKGMSKYMLAFYKKTFYKWQSKYGITYNIDCKKNMIKVWGLPERPSCMYIFVLGEQGEVLYNAGATDAGTFIQAINEAAKYLNN